MDTPNERYVCQVLTKVRELANVMDAEDSLVSEYFDVPARQALTEDELEKLQITQADVASCITLFQNLDKFFNNQAPSTADYSVTVNTVRRSAGN